jgi:hypothetical protein
MANVIISSNQIYTNSYQLDVGVFLQTIISTKLECLDEKAISEMIRSKPELIEDIHKNSADVIGKIAYEKLSTLLPELFI